MSNILIRRANIVSGVVPIDYSAKYLTFEAIVDSTFSFSINNIQYSTDDGTTWSTLTAGSSTPTISAGSKILWKASSLSPDSSNGIGTFSATGNFKAEGNIMSLLFGDSFSDQVSLNGKNYAFYKLFSGNTYLINAENIVLPATTLSTYCYGYMFNGCSSLTIAPLILPATTLKGSCYRRMFYSCSGLTTAPEIHATTQASYACQYMFYSCSSLRTAPALHATTLVSYCYQYMFRYCSSLNYVKSMAVDISATNCMQGWLQGVAASGTFVKNSEATWEVSGDSGIPSGWTVVNA